MSGIKFPEPPKWFTVVIIAVALCGIIHLPMDIYNAVVWIINHVKVTP